MWPLKLKFVNSKHCFIAIPKNIFHFKISGLDQIQVFELECLENIANTITHVSWNGVFSTSEAYIEIDEAFARANRLKDDQLIILKSVKSHHEQITEYCPECSIVPASKDDYELLLRNIEAVENLLIHSVRVVTNNLHIPLWIFNVKIMIKVVDINSQVAQYAILSNKTVLNVLTEGSISDTEKKSSMFDVFKSYISSTTSNETPETNHSSSEHVIDQRPFRVVPLKNQNLDQRYMCSILIHGDDINSTGDDILLCTITKILSYNEYCQASQKELPKQNTTITESYFRSSLVLLVVDNTCHPGTCQVPYNLRRKLGLTISSKINIGCPKKHKLSLPNSMDVTPLDMATPSALTQKDICSMLSSFMSHEVADKFLIVNKYTLICIRGVDYLLEGIVEQSSSVVPYITNVFLQDSNNVKLNTPILSRITTSYGLKLPLKSIADLDVALGFQPYKTNHYNEHDLDNDYVSIHPIICKQLNSKPFSYGPILLHGSKKTGKTFFINGYSKYLASSEELIYTSTLQFKQLRGKRLDSFKKFLIKVLAESYYRQPSVVFFDDIDSVVGKELAHIDQKGPDTIYKKRMIATFIAALAQLEQNNLFFGNRVAIVATCSSLDTLDHQIMNLDDRHYFPNLIEICPPDTERRMRILINLIHEHNNIESQLKDDDLKKISLACDMFLPQDLKTLVEKAMIIAASRNRLDYDSQNVIKLSTGDLQQSLEGYVPIRLRGITLQKKSGRKFNQIGGMENAKEILTSTVLLPLRHPSLFSRCPIKFQTSVLLYGPPGCGKTLLAEAVANEESLNLVCVRGPELLSKYIGASETAVRDLFEKAEAAKPCIIFFDEFESIAPRRGHDSTGVTDRVVNQLLTMMDGFEELSKGIFIVAATSRPDLIDPALLRPGRFDVHVYCGLPDEVDRLKILTIVCSKIKLDSDVDLSVWAKKTEKFSGADLQSLVYSAQLVSLNEKINNTSLDVNGDNRRQETTREERNLVEIIVADRHLLAAINDLGDGVRRNNCAYDKLFPKNFQTSNANVGLGSLRATLA